MRTPSRCSARARSRRSRSWASSPSLSKCLKTQGPDIMRIPSTLLLGGLAALERAVLVQTLASNDRKPGPVATAWARLGFARERVALDGRRRRYLFIAQRVSLVVPRKQGEAEVL